MKNRYLSIALVMIVSSYMAVKPLLSTGFFPMHDDTQPSRVYELSKQVKTGQIPVRWVPDLGYGTGYAMFNFYAPLAYYVGSIPTLFGIDTISSSKWMMGVGMVLAGIVMAWSVLLMRGDWFTAYISGLLYLYAPYHAVQVYVRGAVSEMYAYAFLPLVGCAIYTVAKKRFKKGMIIGAIGYAAILLSHNILGYVVSILLGLSFILLIGVASFSSLSFHQMKRMTLSLALMVVLGIGFSAWFSIPALLEHGYTRVNTLTRGGSDFHQHFLYIDQLWNSPWGYAGSAPGRDDGMSFRIGKLHVLLILGVGIAVCIQRMKKHDLSFGAEIVALSILLLFFLSVWMMTSSSQIVWDHIPGFSFVQYPWRMLTFSVYAASISPLLYCYMIPKKWLYSMHVGVLLMLVGTYPKLFVPQTIYAVEDASYTSYLSLSSRISAISDEYLPSDMHILPFSGSEQERGFLLKTPQGSYPLLSRENRSGSVSFFQDHDTVVSTTLSYYPGWSIAIDGQHVQTKSVDGYIGFALPKGRHTISIELRSTLIQRISNAISIFTLFLLGYLSLLKGDMEWQKRSQ